MMVRNSIFEHFTRLSFNVGINENIDFISYSTVIIIYAITGVNLYDKSVTNFKRNNN